MHPSVGIATWVIGGLLAEILLARAVRQREQDVQSWQLFLQIGITSFLLAVMVWKNSSVVSLLVPTGFLITAVPLALHDLRMGRLPNWLVALSYLLTASALLAATLWGRQPEHLGQSLIGSGLFLLFYAALYMFARGQLGGGDVKLAGVVGAVLGWQGWSSLPSGLLLIWLISAFTYLVATAAGRNKLVNAQPHGPSLVIGTFVAIMATL
ncbi:hypothetical protein GCM10012275_59900 [Longimycelium tulufanense]|uniref:Prepilin type IV endopeptidase peptidase domain-containing protein n=1 Tax=Longimycelium tulufanense TaxID=907463 RepID=A0A8J3CE72_9PSEU|nr:A24 family peptidase [Longimycelium tulufanense]GGM81266.1 hypothetical protein GCM10012275_59900 [Longimycelium tulufanense]